MAADGDAATTSIGAPLWRRLAFPVFALSFGLVCFVLGPSHLLWQVAIGVNVGIGLFTGVDRWVDGITLTPSTAVVHFGRRRSTSVSWSRVQAVTCERVAGRHRIALWSEDGRQILLEAPRGLRDGGHFRRSFAEIERHWTRHRGAGWRSTLLLDL